MIRGVGIDACTVARVQRLHARFGSRFESRLLTARERDGQRLTAAFLAKRFAAKEAVVKALGTAFTQGLFLKDVEILRAPDGQPVVELSARLRQRVGQGVRVHLSLCDEGELALAFAVAEVA